MYYLLLCILQLFGMDVLTRLKRSEKLQNEAARIVTGLTRSVSLEILYRECGWLSLSERRKQQKLNFMYRSANGLFPTYITDVIPPVIKETTTYLLRYQNNITIPFCRTETLWKSCFPSGIALWNFHHESLRNSSSLNSFSKSVYCATLWHNWAATR